MNICVIGTGYVGLVTGACFAEFGVQVVCADNDKAKIDALRRGEIPIYEPGLEQLVERNVAQGRLSFTTDTPDAIKNALVIFISVGTPANPDGSTDLSSVDQVAREIGAVMNEFKVVVTKSTVPVGTSYRVRDLIEAELSKRGKRVNFSVASNPEFLREGAAVNDFMRPDRVVIGADDDAPLAILKDLYRPLYLNETPFVIGNLTSAELTKYVGNAFLATKISFINEVANLCEKIGADVHTVARGIGLDNRIGSKFLHPGPGFGGSCFPKDTRSAVQFARQAGERLSIVETVIEVNERQKARMVDKIVEALDGDVSGKTVAVLGLSFKPETDDMRDAPAVAIVEGLQKEGASIRAYDPVAMAEAAKLLPEVTLCDDPYDAASGADALVIVTEWNQFRMLDLERIRKALRRPVMVDLRNVYDPAPMRERGFEYHCVGR